jgi:hypothetical protein
VTSATSVTFVDIRYRCRFERALRIVCSSSRTFKESSVSIRSICLSAVIALGIVCSPSAFATTVFVHAAYVPGPVVYVAPRPVYYVPPHPVYYVPARPPVYVVPVARPVPVVVTVAAPPPPPKKKPVPYATVPIPVPVVVPVAPPGYVLVPASSIH